MMIEEQLDRRVISVKDHNQYEKFEMSFECRVDKIDIIRDGRARVPVGHVWSDDT